MSLPPSSSPPADAHTLSNEWDDEEGEAVEAESRAHAADETVIVPIEARPPPMRQSSMEEDGESDDDDSSDDGAEIRLPPAPLPVMAPRGSSAGAVVRSSPGLIIARTSPAAAAAAAVEAAASASLLHDAISNPPPPPPSAAVAAAAGDPAKPSRSPGAGVNVISIPKPQKHEAGVKQEDDAEAADEDQMDDEAAAEEEEDQEGSDSYTPQDDEEPNVKMEDEPSASDTAAAPSVSLTGAGGAKLRLILPKNPSTNGAAKARSSSPPSDAVKLESGRTQAAAANSSSSHAASSSSAFAAPAPRAILPNSLIPPTTGLTPHGKATLARYRSYFFGRQWPDAKLLRISGREITEKWMNECAMRVPFIATSAAEIGLRAPGPDTSIRTVCESLPPAHILSVIDVATQSESSAWSLAQWVSYFETPAEQRTAVCNVISLEISNSEFAKNNLLAPKFARDISWNTLWPTEAQAAVTAIKTPTAQQRLVAGAAPSAASAAAVTAAPATQTVPIPPPTPVQLYCLMGTAGSYTDWHADFGGSSVWYHVVRGQKLFLLVEPTADNLAVYEQWHHNGKALTTFLADRFAERDRAKEVAEGLEPGSLHTVKLFAVNAGETLFVPSGFIHSVYTPVDSLVFGGNFLHGYSIASQLCIYNLELNTNVEPRFQYPNFESIHWLAMRDWVFRLRKPLAQLHVSLAELHGLATLVKTAANWMEQSAIGVRDGYEAARPRRGSKAPVSGHHQRTADAAAEARPDQLDWSHNIPISWNDAVTLLRELDCLLIYNSYLIEREDFDDRMESRREAAEASSSSADDPSSTAELSLDGWCRREQLAQKCFQLLESFSSNLYPIVPMVPVYSLPFLRKPKNRSQRMSAADSAATIAGALKPKSQRALASFQIEEKAAPAPTTSGRVRQHVARYREYVTDDDDDDEDEEGEGNKRSKSGAAAATAAAPSQGAGMPEEEEKESSRPAAPVAPAPLSARKRRTPPPQVFSGSESDDDAFSSDVESDVPEEEEEAYDATGKKRRKARGSKQSKKARTGDDEAASAAAPASAPVGVIKLSDLKARAAAAAAASMSAGKKVIPAGAPVGAKKPRKPAQPKSAAALAAASIGKAKPTLSAKARIMQKLGLSGKLR